MSISADRVDLSDQDAELLTQAYSQCSCEMFS